MTLSLMAIKNPVTEKSKKDPITEKHKDYIITESPKEDHIIDNHWQS